MPSLLQENLNPLDGLETIFDGFNWSFDRPSAEEMILSLTGKNNNYNSYFVWDNDLKILQICCEYDFTLEGDTAENPDRVIGDLNQNLALGHLELSSDEKRPAFRYSCLMHGLSDEQCQHMLRQTIDLTLSQCERYAPLLKLLSITGPVSNDDLTLASLEVKGSC